MKQMIAMVLSGFFLTAATFSFAVGSSMAGSKCFDVKNHNVCSEGTQNCSCKSAPVVKAKAVHSH